MNLPTALPSFRVKAGRPVWPRASVLLTAILAIGSSLTLRAQTDPAAAPPSPTAPPASPAATPVPEQTAPDATTVVEAAPAAFNDLEPIYKLQEMFFFSPIINGIIAGLSVLALMFFLWFLLTINSRAVAPAAFVNEITNLVLVQRYDAAADACRRSKGVFIAPIILRCVENHGKNQSIILNMIDTEGRRLSDIIWNRISYLADISNVAPMLGLLGTVIGMITAFFGLDKESGSVNSSVLSQGVGQAMATTMFGLLVGITALVFYSIIKSRATKTLAEAESAVHSIADRIRGMDDEDEDEPPSKLL
ncbi:MAG: MotA/TolQ/ExbB proton channel family protein [Planctomycetota bacterium]